MKQRVITAIVMVAVMIPFFIFSWTLAFPVLAGFLAAVGIFEMQRCIGSVKHYAVSVPTVIAAAGMPFLVRYVKNDVIGYVFFICFALITYTFAVSVFSKHRFPVETAAFSCSTAVYISFGFSALVLLRDLEHGRYIYLLAFIIPWVTDTFAYFCGRAFGKHKLIPDVSPKKTVEGALGGIALTVISFAVYSLVICRIYNYHTNYLAVAILAVITAIISMIGDLIASLVKRHYGIKDYGKLFPGHGGVMDRFDSIIATSISLYTLVKISDFFVIFK